MKRCPKCKEIKPFSEFYSNRTRKDGCASYCKDCESMYTSERVRRKHPRASKYENIEYNKLAYLAGIIDGEGCLELVATGTNRKRTSIPQITIGTVDNVLVEWVHSNFGGWFYKQERTGNWRDCYYWRLKNKTYTTELLKKVLPYLVVKKLQAEILIEAGDLRPYERKKYAPEEIQYFQRLNEKLKNLKRGSNEDISSRRE